MLFSIGIILIFYGYLMDSLVGNIIGLLVGFIMIGCVAFYSDLKEWIRLRRG